MMKQSKVMAYLLFFFCTSATTSCTKVLMGDEGEYDEDIFLNYQTKTTLELPFENETEWRINQGGRSGIQNNHFSNREQRYGVDFGRVLNGSAFTGDGTKNEDYYSFGERLYAPGEGRIIAVRNTVDDNETVGVFDGGYNGDQPLGNYILIDHLNGEFSFMAHFKKNSIIVELGDIVIRGQEVGKVGNSGRSTGPHLHYHMQTTPNFKNGVGLPMQFLKYYADDVFIKRGEPINGQIVRKD